MMDTHATGKALRYPSRNNRPAAGSPHLTIITDQLGRHDFILPPKEHVEKQRFNHVVAMMAEGDLGGAEFLRHAIDDAPTQERRTQGAM